ncbi:MAG: hypothetical protein IPK84_01295 [Candidatus Moraniibacteriota bacterium]|nr:MAG: hypothetical protein IPK84_01295 [Candidatus Moranbacteria bacterium]
MRFYQSPIKNPAATSLSFLLGAVVITAIVLSLRVADSGRLAQNAEQTTETIPIDPALSETQRIIQEDREQKLKSSTPALQKTITETKPVKTTTLVPSSTSTSSSSSSSTTTKKADRTTRTS